MKGEQLDLLSWVRPSAVILLFPVDREAKRIRDVARQLDRKQGKLADKYWRTECNRLAGRLEVQGLPKDRIAAELDCFARAVRAELERHYWPQIHGEGGDAA